MTEVAMPLNELDLWLQARVGQGAAATDLSMLDGFVAAHIDCLQRIALFGRSSPRHPHMVLQARRGRLI